MIHYECEQHVCIATKLDVPWSESKPITTFNKLNKLWSTCLTTNHEVTRSILDNSADFRSELGLENN